MMPRHAGSGRLAALALAVFMTGCSDSSPFRFGSLKRGEVSEPNPGGALAIRNAPSTAANDFDDQVKPATFVAPMRGGLMPPAEPAIVDQPLRVLYQRAADQHAKMDSYIFRLKRREVVNGKKQAEELVRVQVRRDPYSVHLKWLDEKFKGREVIYVQGKYDNKMQVLLSPNDSFAFLGRRHSFALDDSMVRAESRHPITNTGFGSLIDGFGRLIAAVERAGPRDSTAKYLGLAKRPEFEAKLETVHQVLPANCEPGLPKGGQRWWFFDATSGLPVLIITHDPTGEVEYYCHDHIQSPARLDDNDFNPQRLWGK